MVKVKQKYTSLVKERISVLISSPSSWIPVMGPYLKCQSRVRGLEKNFPILMKTWRQESEVRCAQFRGSYKQPRLLLAPMNISKQAAPEIEYLSYNSEKPRWENGVFSIGKDDLLEIKVNSLWQEKTMIFCIRFAPRCTPPQRKSTPTYISGTGGVLIL